MRRRTLIGARESGRIVKEILEQMHVLLNQGPHAPLTDEEQERLDALAATAWEISLAHGTTPHTCKDRYCHCHVVLWEAEPEGLFPRHDWL
jgi:hypothetical protein